MPAPGSPTIASFSNDSGVVGDHVTNDKTLTLTGTAAANSTVNVFDGNTKIGTATATGSGSWSFTTSALVDGDHNFSATATNSSGTSSASAALAVKIDTVAPNAPVEVGDSIVNGTQVQLTGTAEANSTVKVYDGSALVGIAHADGAGAWAVLTSSLSGGAHNLTATATDAAGNVSVASSALDPLIGAQQIELAGSTKLVQSGNNYFFDNIEQRNWPGAACLRSACCGRAVRQRMGSDCG